MVAYPNPLQLLPTHGFCPRPFNPVEDLSAADARTAALKLQLAAAATDATAAAQMVAAPAITAAAMLAHHDEHNVPAVATVPMGLGAAVALLRSWAVPVSRNTTAGVVALADAAAAAGGKLKAAQDAIRQGGTPVPQDSALIAERDTARATYVEVCATATTAIDAGRAELAAAEPELQTLLLRLAEAEAAILPPEIEPDVPSIGPPEACIAAALTAVRSWEDHIAADAAAGVQHLQDSLAAFLEVCVSTAEQRDPSVLAKELPAAHDAIIAALAAEADRAVATAEAFPVAAVAAGIAAMRRDSEAEAAAIVRVRELEQEMNDAVSEHSVIKPDLEAAKALKKDVRKAKLAVLTAKEALDAVIEDEGSDSEDAATARDELITAKEAFAAATRAHAANLAALVQLKASHFPEIDVAAPVPDTAPAPDELAVALEAVKLSATGSSSRMLDISTVERSKTVLGRGGTATVYLGYWRHTANKPAIPVALKVFEAADNSMKEVAMRELNRGILLHGNPHLAETYGWIATPSSSPHARGQLDISLVVELLQGGTLEAALLPGPDATLPPLTERLQWLVDVATGMAALHRHLPPVVHRDLKAVNVMLTGPDPTTGARAAKVCDFGLVDFAKATRSVTTRGGGSMAGTLGWKAPETYNHSARLPADVFSFAMLIYEVIEGRRPFDGMRDTEVLGLLNKRFEYDEDYAEVADRSAQMAKWLKKNPLKARRPEIRCESADAAPPIPTLIALMQDCWADAPEERPSFIEIEARLRGIVASTVPVAAGVSEALTAAASAEVIAAASKFVSAGEMVFGNPAEAVLGLPCFLGIDDAAVARFLTDPMGAISSAVAEHGTATDKDWFDLITSGTFTDSAGETKTLDELLRHPAAVAAELGRHHVLALRLYTSPVYPSINDPLRRKSRPHPLAAVVYFVDAGIKKLRAADTASGDVTSVATFWRGLKNLRLPEDFLTRGGTECGCMSTSASRDIAAGFAASEHPLLVKFVTKGFMNRGADLEWLTVFPGECEALYPPLTYIRPIKAEFDQIGGARAVVIEVEPVFPT